MNSFAIESVASLYDLYCVDPHELATINKHANTLPELYQVAMAKGDHLFYKLHVYCRSWGYEIADLMHLCKDVCTTVRQSQHRYMGVKMWKPLVVERYVAAEDLEKFRADPSQYVHVNSPDSKRIRGLEYCHYAELKKQTVRLARKAYGWSVCADDVNNPCCCWFSKTDFSIVCHNEAEGKVCDRVNYLAGLVAQAKLRRALRCQSYESGYDTDSESDSESDYSSESDSESEFSSESDSDSESEYSSEYSESESERSTKRRRHH